MKIQAPIPMKMSRKKAKTAFYFILSGIMLLNIIQLQTNAVVSQSSSEIDFRGITYELQYLDATVNSSFISEPQIRSDLELLQQLNINYLRTMGTKYGQDLVPQIAGEYGIKCATGAWISWNETDSYEEIDRALNISENSEFLIIGSDVYSRGEVSIDQLSAYIEYTKENTTKLVTTSASWQFWIEHYDIGSDCDIIFVEIDPLVELTDVSDINIGGFVESTLNSLQAMYVGKEIIFSIGFPSANHTLANENNQKRFYQNLLEKLADSDIKCFNFEAFDVPNRQYYSAAGNAGPNWGLFREDRSPKPVVSIFNEYFGGTVDVPNEGVPGFYFVAPISVVTVISFAFILKRKINRS